MNMTEQEELRLVRKHRPRLFFDKKEPFSVDAVGYTVFAHGGRSRSFPARIIRPPEGGRAIEYVFWYDYDIQHLYELEHIWVYLDAEGKVKDAEGSFHGKFLRLVEPYSGRIPLDEAGRVLAYAQPGKHALMAAPELFRLFVGAKRCCMEDAGADGIAPGRMVQEYFTDIPAALQEKTKAYIRANYAFVPSFDFEEREWDEGLLMPWETLLATIPERMRRQIRRIEEWEGKDR